MSSRNRSDDQMKCVYMGPPMRRNLLDSLKERLAGNKPKKSYPGSFADDSPLTEEPEPGPEPGTLPEPAPETKEPFDPRAMEGVYAGPDMQNVPPMAPVYAGPEMMNDPQWDPRVRIPDGPRMEALYAAPRRPQPSEMMMVYAGPDYFANKKNSQAPMMMVYAGPPMRRNLLDSLKERLAGNKPKKSYPGSFADDSRPSVPAAGRPSRRAASAASAARCFRGLSW